jgi:hypothetical protein
MRAPDRSPAKGAKLTGILTFLVLANAFLSRTGYLDCMKLPWVKTDFLHPACADRGSVA